MWDEDVFETRPGFLCKAEEVGVSVCNDHIDFFAKFSDWDESCEYVKLV